MMIILIAPEIGVGMAVGEFLAARRELRLAKDRFPEEEDTLTLTHGFYSIMGGYAGARKYDRRRSMFERPHPDNWFGPKQSSSENVSYTTVVSIALQPVGNRSRNRDLEGEHVETESSAVKVTNEKQNMRSPLQGTPLAVDYKELYGLNLSEYVKACRELPIYPNQLATENDLNDRSKSDAFTKIFTIVQITWLVVQSIARVSAGLPLSQLELATMAYVLCAIIMYSFWWYKPFLVETVTIVPNLSGVQYPVMWARKAGLTSADISKFSFAEAREGHDAFQKLMFCLTATAFGAVHVAAWNWQFPSHLAKTLWRAFSTATTAAGPYIVAQTYFGLGTTRICFGFLECYNLTFISTVIVFIIYAISRFGLIVLAIYSLSSMPAAVYETVEWTVYLPHFG